MTGSAFLRLPALVGALSLGGLAVAGTASAQYDWSDVKDALDNSPFLHGALIVYHKGEERYRTGFGWWDSYDDEALADVAAINVASLSKTFTAALAMTVMEDPNVDLSLDDLVKDHIPNALSLNNNRDIDGNYVYDLMTVDHLISMTSGHRYFLPWPTNPLTCVNNPLFAFETCGENMVSGNLAKPPGLFINYFYSPGEAFSYSSAAWQILGLILVRAVNDAYSASYDFEQVLELYLTGEGACDLQKTAVKPANNEWPAGGFENDLIDGGALAQALLSGECGDNHQLLSAASRSKMQEDTKRFTTATANNPDSTGLSYGRGQWLYYEDDDPCGPTEDPCTKQVLSYMGVGAWGSITFHSPDGDWAAYLHLNDHMPHLQHGLAPGYVDAVELAKELTALIDSQAAANP